MAIIDDFKQIYKDLHHLTGGHVFPEEKPQPAEPPRPAFYCARCKGKGCENCLPVANASSCQICHGLGWVLIADPCSANGATKATCLNCQGSSIGQRP